MDTPTFGARKRAQSASDNFSAAVVAIQAAVNAAAPSASDLRNALISLASYNIPSAVPRPAVKSDAASVKALLAQANVALAAALGRQTAIQTAIGGMSSSDWSAVNAARDTCQAIFGRDLPFLVSFTPVEAQPGQLTSALSGAPDLFPVGQNQAEILRRLLMGAARVRTPLDLWRRMSFYATALGSPGSPWNVVQLPYQPGDSWVGLPFDIQSAGPPPGCVSVAISAAAVPAATGKWVGLMLDEWTEIIPSASATTGIAFNYQAPAAQAPQAVLLAVPPNLGGAWDLEVLVDILKETLDLAHIRAVDATLAGSLGQFLPAACLAFNTRGDTVSTDFQYVESAP
jgi:hypothetical protein